MGILQKLNVAIGKEAAVAAPGYSRWLMAAAALLIHFPLGQAYGFSVFNGPLVKVLGSSLTSVGWIFSAAIIFLGLSAAIFGKWVERVGPRKAMLASALCFFVGFLVSALGVVAASLPIVILGYGVIGGTGLGIGYISPVSTLIKWFPDKRGMATGLAIMGFGGGALVGSPLAVNLMKYFSEGSLYGGIPATFVTMAVVYLCFQLAAVSIARLPFPGYLPAGWVPSKTEADHIASQGADDFSVAQAIRKPQFWLLWGILLLNVSAGIGILGQASLMAQKMVGISPAAAAGFVGLLSLCNMAGRFIWSSFSDKIGRKWAYAMYSGVGALAYWAIPGAAAAGNMLLFVALFALVMSFYGAGFATIPAYLADMFGKKEVGAIHGRLLTAWSMAGVIGPLVVNAGRDYLVKNQGLADAAAYSTVVYILGGLLVAEFALNLFVKAPESNASLEMPAQLATQ
ncbi:OFA family MFS transporter [Undibacterium sp. JH2W]|uniref:OFA family MFS transporter n=1 Tax=Undibacterium sp. JH2W TaxID=3413037 RepID=UPI003BF12932